MNNEDEIVHQHSNHAGRGGGNGNSQTGAEGSLLTATAPTTISAHTMLLQLRDQQEERQRLLLAMPTDKGNQLQRQHQEWHSSASDIGLRVTETQPGFSLCNLNPNKQWQRSLLFSQPSPTQQMHNHNQSSSSGINSTTNAIDLDQIALLLRHLLQNTQHPPSSGTARPVLQPEAQVAHTGLFISPYLNQFNRVPKSQPQQHVSDNMLSPLMQLQLLLAYQPLGSLQFLIPPASSSGLDVLVLLQAQQRQRINVNAHLLMMLSQSIDPGNNNQAAPVPSLAAAPGALLHLNDSSTNQNQITNTNVSRQEEVNVNSQQEQEDEGLTSSLKLNSAQHSSWDLKYKALCGFRSEHGHCKVPARYEKDTKLG